VDPWGYPAGFLSDQRIGGGLRAVKSYDLVYIIRPDLEADAFKAVVDRMSQRITDQAGTIEAVDVWGKKRMMYTVGKFREGHFVHTRFSIDPQKVEEIRRAAALTEDVLRATITNAVGKLPEAKVETAAPATPPAPVGETPEPSQPAEA
jgi:small subunit ribosomal protein S6